MTTTVVHGEAGNPLIEGLERHNQRVRKEIKRNKKRNDGNKKNNRD